MFQKVKDFLNNSVTLFVGLVLAIFYLFERNRSISEKLAESKAEEKLKDVQGQQKQIDSNANDSMDEYTKLRDRYREEHKDDVQ